MLTSALKVLKITADRGTPAAATIASRESCADHADSARGVAFVAAVVCVSKKTINKKQMCLWEIIKS